MIEPKVFYRDFDTLLKEIRLKKTGKNFLCSILSEVQNKFGKTLHFGSLRLYEDRGDTFKLIRTFEKNKGHEFVERLSLKADEVQQVLKHGSYIYDESQTTIAPEMSARDGYGIPAAIVIRSPEQRWIVVFELKSGWVREEVTFSLNAIRTAINYRLFSEAVKTELQQAAQIQRSLLPGDIRRLPVFRLRPDHSRQKSSAAICTIFTNSTVIYSAYVSATPADTVYPPRCWYATSSSDCAWGWKSI